MIQLFAILLAAFTPAQQSRSQASPPSMVPIPPPPDINSEEFQQQLAGEQSAALGKISRSRRSVTRSFAVGWEMHHGLFLVPANARDWLRAEWFTPDFLAGDLRDRLAAAAVPNAPTMAAHYGQKLVCRCTGVEWSFYGQKRFLIREAELEWK